MGFAEFKKKPTRLPDNLPEVTEAPILAVRMSDLTETRLKEIVARLVNNMFLSAKRSKMIGWTMQEFGVAHDLAAELIDFAFTIIKEDIKWEIANELDLAIARRQDLYDRCCAVGDYKTAHTILQDLNKLRGLYDTNATAQQQTQLTFIVENLEMQANNIIEIERNEDGGNYPAIDFEVGEEQDDTFDSEPID